MGTLRPTRALADLSHRLTLFVAHGLREKGAVSDVLLTVSDVFFCCAGSPWTWSTRTALRLPSSPLVFFFSFWFVAHGARGTQNNSDDGILEGLTGQGLPTPKPKAKAKGKGKAKAKAKAKAKGKGKSKPKAPAAPKKPKRRVRRKKRDKAEADEPSELDEPDEAKEVEKSEAKPVKKEKSAAQKEKSKANTAAPATGELKVDFPHGFRHLQLRSRATLFFWGEPLLWGTTKEEISQHLSILSTTSDHFVDINGHSHCPHSKRHLKILQTTSEALFRTKLVVCGHSHWLSFSLFVFSFFFLCPTPNDRPGRRIPASGGKRHSFVGRQDDHPGFHCTQPTTAAGMVLSIEIKGETYTLFRGNELVAGLSKAFKNHSINVYTICEQVSLSFSSVIV